MNKTNRCTEIQFDLVLLLLLLSSNTNKLDFSASVGFIHKESVTMHGHTIVKNHNVNYSHSPNLDPQCY